MSLVSFGSSILKQNQDQILGTTIHNDIDRLVLGISTMIDRQPKPFIFLKSNNNNLSSNVADGVLILSGPLIREGEKGVVEDFNINFTTAAGTIRLVIVDSGNTIVTDILRDITASTNGTGKTVLDPGQRLAIVGQSAGAGVFSVYCSGYVQKVV